MSTITTITTADRDRLKEGNNTDLLTMHLLDMARYDMQSARIEIDQAEDRIAVIQQPHQGDETETVNYGPIANVVSTWLDSEETRTGRADIYDLEADEVAQIRAIIAEETSAA